MDPCVCSNPSSSSSRPQNRYLINLLDAFEKSSVETKHEFARLQKDYQVYKRAVANAQNDLKEMKADRDTQAERIDTLEKEVAKQRMLHLQLREEASNEFRSLAKKNGSRDKDIKELKLQSRLDTQKRTFDLENLKWELTNLGNNYIDSTMNIKHRSLETGETTETGTDSSRGNLLH